MFKPCHVVFLFDSTSNFVSAPLSLWGHQKRPCGLRLLVLYSDLRGFPVSFGSLLCSESFFPGTLVFSAHQKHLLLITAPI